MKPELEPVLRAAGWSLAWLITVSQRYKGQEEKWAQRKESSEQGKVPQQAEMLQGREQTACSPPCSECRLGVGMLRKQSDSKLSCLGLFYFYCFFSPFCFVLFLGSALHELLRQTWICRMSRAAGRGTAGIGGVGRWLRWI